MFYCTEIKTRNNKSVKKLKATWETKSYKHCNFSNNVHIILLSSFFKALL